MCGRKDSRDNSLKIAVRFGLPAQADMDYTKLRDLLAEGKFQQADDETRALLIKLAGPGAIERKWVYFTEVGCYPLSAFDGRVAKA